MSFTSNISKKFLNKDLKLKQIIVMRSGKWRKSNDISNETRWKYDFIWTDQKHRIVYNNLRDFLMKNEIKVHMIGSSHMRENFDLMMESLRINGGFKIGGNSSVYDGLNWGLKYNATLLAKDQNKHLKDLCSIYEGCKDQKRVIVIQNGAWDLFESSLRYCFGYFIVLLFCYFYSFLLYPPPSGGGSTFIICRFIFFTSAILAGLHYSYIRTIDFVTPFVVIYLSKHHHLH
jgi:hypothetical protein